MTTASTVDASELKEEGNKLFVAKKYAVAYEKYSQATDADGQNAVLFANRGACSFALKKYMDAAQDCSQATKLDPSYTKAWARLGASLKNTARYDHSVSAYKSALESLPSNDAALTDAQRSLKRQCIDELQEVKQKLQGKSKIQVLGRAAQGKTPWMRAWNMRQELEQAGPARGKSSAWVMLKAYQEFKQGTDIIKQVRTVRVPEGQRITGLNGGILYLTNGIMRDRRVFHVDDPDWQRHHRLQVEMELLRDNADHLTSGGAQYVIAEALKMKAKGGWDAVRPALSTIVRCWITNGFNQSGMGQNPIAAVEFYDRAVELLEWGREAWKDVPKDLRGAIFEDTFLVGVKAMRLDAYADRCVKAQSTPEGPTLLEGLRDAASSLTADAAKAAKPEATDPGFWLSFYVYPKAQAMAMVALYHSKKAEQAPDEDKRQEHYREAALFYAEAAETYPADDEYNIYFLTCSLDHMLLSHAMVRAVDDIIERIEERLPEVKAIWEYSSRKGWMDNKMPWIEEMGRKFRALLASGEVQPESWVTDEMWQ